MIENCFKKKNEKAKQSPTQINSENNKEILEWRNRRGTRD